MVPAYKAMDLLLFPTFIESFGCVSIEAMAAERPVVASAVGGIPEAVVDGVSGLLVPPGDEPGITEAILRIMGNQAEARKMGIEGRKRVKALFSIEETASKVERIYSDILGR